MDPHSVDVCRNEEHNRCIGMLQWHPGTPPRFTTFSAPTKITLDELREMAKKLDELVKRETYDAPF